MRFDRPVFTKPRAIKNTVTICQTIGVPNPAIASFIEKAPMSPPMLSEINPTAPILVDLSIKARMVEENKANTFHASGVMPLGVMDNNPISNAIGENFNNFMVEMISEKRVE